MSISDSTQLPERSLHLFKALVEHFIKDGQPVGSRTLARDSSMELSPATIRNVMADLEDLGLLRSAHTSAGRVPTVKGYRLFIDSLLRVGALDEKEVQHIAEELETGQNLNTLMERVSTILSDVTKLAGVVTLPRTEQKALKQVEFVSLSKNQVLVILVVSDNEIQNRIIHTAKQYSPSELQQASNYLSQVFGGKDLPSVRTAILDELENMKTNVNQLMQTAIEIAQQAFVSGDTKKDYVLTGQTNLMDVAELSDVEKLKKLFDTFNQKKDVLHLLEQAINASGVQIFIGEESGYDVFDDCSVVTSPYKVNGEIMGVLGVIGPTRMNYEKVIPIVDVTARMLGSALNSLN
ncbi:MAG: heat-inducible transcriptional repressor [Gammaproteobacteria bacterium]|jgi:heat-inducible transcriptional repressor